MAAKYGVSIAACFMLALAQVSGLQTVNGKIKITIGTTSGCGDTVRFITGPLAEAYRLYGDFLEIEFVPWGRTRVDDNGVFTCQFGPADCWANRLHRCVLNILKDNQAAQVDYMICEFTSPYPSYLQGSYTCVQTVGVSLIAADHCVRNPGDDDLDSTAQAAALEPMNPNGGINFVPFVILNDDIDVTLHREALVRLPSMICSALAADPSTGITSCPN